MGEFLDCTDGDIYGERGARAYEGGLGLSPRAGLSQYATYAAA